MAKRRHHQVINLVHFLGAQSHGTLDASRFPVDLLYVYVTCHSPFVFHIVCTLVFQSFRVHAAHAKQALHAFRQGYVTFYKSGKVTFLRSYRCEFNVAGNVTLQGFPLPDANESLAATAQCAAAATQSLLSCASWRSRRCSPSPTL